MAVGLMGRMLQVWRFQRIGNRHRNDGGLLSAQGLAAEVDHDGGIEQHRDAEEGESALVVAGQVFEEAHEVWADESTEDAEGVNGGDRQEEHTSELQSPCNLVCRLLLEKKKNN